MSDRLLVATRKGLFALDRSGATWTLGVLGFLGEPVVNVLADPRDGAIYAALNRGAIHRSRDAGATWTPCGLPAYPDGARLDFVWALEAGGADEPGVLWAGTVPGGLFRSPDRGATWELCRGLWDRPERARWVGGGTDGPGIHSICVDPRDSRCVAVGISVGGVWGTRDGGATWSCRSRGLANEDASPERRGDPNAQNPHRLVQSPSHPDVLWTQHHGGVARSSTWGEHWEDCSYHAKPSRFGFAAAVHPRDPKTAWFAPVESNRRRIPVDGRVVVMRTRNGGTTFDVLTGGLPREHAYDLVHRHGLDVDATGNTLAFGSTTGNLWLSEDGGDAWRLVSAHLPPVHAVRFVR